MEEDYMAKRISSILEEQERLSNRTGNAENGYSPVSRKLQSSVV